MSRFFGTDDPRLKPIWTRLSIVLVVVVWAISTVWMGDGLWMFIAGMALFYCVWTLLIAYSPPPDEPEDET